jgi:RHS repeat-associated protein
MNACGYSAKPVVSIRSRVRQSPFGEMDDTLTYQFGNTGRQFLAILWLRHCQARMYSPALGRFLQTDPVGYQDDLNWYAYVKSDPVNLTDPSGKIASLSGSFASSGSAASAPAATEPKLVAPVIAVPPSQMGDAIQVAGVVTNPSHYINRVELTILIRSWGWRLVLRSRLASWPGRTLG